MFLQIIAVDPKGSILAEPEELNIGGEGYPYQVRSRRAGTINMFIKIHGYLYTVHLHCIYKIHGYLYTVQLHCI